MTIEIQRKSVTLHDSTLAEMAPVERLKAASEGLFYVQAPDGSRHTFRSEIEALSAGEAQTLGEQAKEISKHFGIYKQRLRNDSGKKDGDFIFMVRVKNPAGGELSAAQWLDLDEGASYGDGSLRLTSRQGIQYHYVPGRRLQGLVTHINRSHSSANGYRPTTLGACGDVNRNTVASPIDDLDFELPLDTHLLAHEVARELAPRSSAYYQVFLADEDGAQIAPLNSDEPVYGTQYMPRKWKVGFAHPNDNSVDLLTNDVGFLPVVESGRVIGYDYYSGGGLGMTHNQPQTAPLLAIYLGRVPRDQVLACVRATLMLQRDYGERRDRRQARWKYTIRRLGPQWVAEQLRGQFGIALDPVGPAPLPPVRDLLGWYREAGSADCYYAGIHVPFGRLNDNGARRRSALRKIVEGIDGVGVRITPNQSLLLTHIPAARRTWVEEVLAEHSVPFGDQVPTVRKLAIACPAKPTCGLAMTYAERDLPRYLDALAAEGLADVDVMIRMAGCPNGCPRPATAEIGITGYGKNEYVVGVGGARDGSRLTRVLYPRLNEIELVVALTGLVRAVRDHNPRHLPAGDFLDQTTDAELRRMVGLSESSRNSAA